MLKRSPIAGAVLFFALIIPVIFATTLFLTPTEVARGKSAAIPLNDSLTPDQQLAQDLALADSRVQAYTTGQRTEVFGVAKFIDINTPINALGCGTDNCRVVNIFNFDASATVQAFVRLDTKQVVEVYYQEGLRPGINRRLADRAMEIALNEPSVIEIIGEQRTNSDWAPMDSTLVGSACERGHMCVAPTFNMGDYILWAIVDLTDDKFLDTFWTATEGAENGVYQYPDEYADFTPDGGCPASGSVNRNGWQLDYNTTNWDGFRVSNARYNGSVVITSAKLVEWHADYGSSGFQDSTGCSSGGGGFTIFPFGETQVFDLIESSVVVGFEVVQDFRMSNWGAGCNYRYEQRFQFYTDGRFRTVQGAYGKGCGTNSLYRGLMRIDLAAGGTTTNDNIATWNGSAWAPVSTETRWCPEGASHATCTGFVPGVNPDGYRFRIWDSTTNSGYYMEPGRGQFGDAGQGDNEFVYAVVHNASEGDSDMGVFGAGCCNDFNHGPEQYVNSGTLTNSNLVIWYIPQALTDASAPGYYCWTLTPPETYPCFTGPMFHPYTDGEATPTPTNTAVPPSNTPTATATNTAVPPTATATPTNTAVPPTSTATVTNTAVPPTNTATVTNTAVPPTATATPSVTTTGTPVQTPTVTPTGTLPAPDIEISATAVTETHTNPPQQTFTNITIQNTGNEDLFWEIFEDNGGLTPNAGLCDGTGNIPWLTSNPTSGTIPPGGSTSVEFTFNSASLPNGLYEGTVCVASNDVDESLIQLPVSLQVGAPTAVELATFTNAAPVSVPVALIVGGLLLIGGAVFVRRRQ